jgi:metallo-beta-lactamase family protein
VGKHAHPKPLYDSLAAEKSMRLFRSVEFGEQIQVKDIQFQLHPAGHILGAASIIVEADGKRVGFSGDVGRSDDILMRPPEPLPPLDLLLLESTYGNRLHERHDPAEQLASIVNRVTSRGGVLLVPAFAVGRTQALQHLLATLIDKGSIPRIPIYLDSPMAIKVSDIFCDRSELHRLTEDQCHRMEDLVTYTRTVDESKALSGQAFPHIIIAGSGMATGGRILHHFKRLLGKPGTEVLFTGYQSGGTRGARMLEGADTVKIHGQWIPVKAHVEMIDSLSGHADYLELGSWLARSELKPTTKIQLVHGSPDALEGMRVHIQETTAFPVSVAEHHSILRL